MTEKLIKGSIEKIGLVQFSPLLQEVFAWRIHHEMNCQIGQASLCSGQFRSVSCENYQVALAR